MTIAHTYGWRMQSEVLTLQKRQVDFEAGTIRLDPGQTMNDEPRLALSAVASDDRLNPPCWLNALSIIGPPMT